MKLNDYYHTMLPMSVKHLLNEHRLIVLMGQGGVGKTTVSATLGIRAAQEGLRVAVLTIDPANRLADVFAIDAEMHQLTPIELPEVTGSLHALMLDRKLTCDALVKRFSTDSLNRERTLSNPYYKHFSTSLSGGQEYMAIESVYQQLISTDFDLIILDTPPSIHAFDFLDAPKRLLNGIRRLPSMRDSHQRQNSLLSRIKNRSGAIIANALARFTGQSFLADLTEFLILFKDVLSALSESSQHLERILKSEQTAFVYVDTLDHGVGARINHWLSALRSREMKGGSVIFNRTQPQLNEIDASKIHKRLSSLCREQFGKENAHKIDAELEIIANSLCEPRDELNTQAITLHADLNTLFLPFKRHWISSTESLTALAQQLREEL